MNSAATCCLLAAVTMVAASRDGASATVRYVDVNSATPTPPYTNWATAARTIQDAVNAAAAGDELVVTNGTYATGGRAVGTNVLVNRVAVDKPLTLRSVNGPQVTVIQGYQVPDTTNGDGAVRCVCLTDGATLSGFTLTKGATATNYSSIPDNPSLFLPAASDSSGGGVLCISTIPQISPVTALVTNCVVTGNSACYVGGGAAFGTLNNCVLSNNLAGYGGGASYSTLNNCAIITNSARMGGGTFLSDLNTCLLSGNSAAVGAGACGGVATDCALRDNQAGYGGGASGKLWDPGTIVATLNHCTLTGNSASYGGGAGPYTSLNSCSLTGNSAGYGGGALSSTLNDCTLSSNSASGYGGGAWDSTLSNCMLTANSALGDGGGAEQCTLSNCTLTANSAEDQGGGADDCELLNCALTHNSADIGGGASGTGLVNCTVVDNLAWDFGGGAAYSSLRNCIVAYNAAWTEPNYTDSDLDYCCTSPLPTNGVGNISVPPLFVDYASGNLRLQSNSPCINAGNNAYLNVYAIFTNTLDLDDLPRAVSGTVDMGAYEYQGSGSRISYAWLQQYGLPTDGSADAADPDNDGMTNWQEWMAGTNPTNALSALRLVSALPAGTNMTVTWQSVAGVSYVLERSTNLWGSPAFLPLANGIPGQPGTTSYTDTNATGAGPFFYRVGVGY